MGRAEQGRKQFRRIVRVLMKKDNIFNILNKIDDLCTELANESECEMAWFLRGALDAFGEEQMTLDPVYGKYYRRGYEAARRIV